MTIPQRPTTIPALDDRSDQDPECRRVSAIRHPWVRAAAKTAAPPGAALIAGQNQQAA